VTDFDSLDLKRQLPVCVMVLDELVSAGYRVYVHCTAGVTRSPTVIAAYLHWKLHWPLEEGAESSARRWLGDVIRRCQPIE
jgi:protein-tyrosine phosphatase